MDQMQWEKSLRDSKYRHQRKNPSFSSSLLDEIYRSIDEGDHHRAREEEEELVVYRETMKKKQNKREEEEEMESFRRDSFVEKWMEKKVMSEKVVVRRKSVPDFSLQKTQNRSSMIFNSTSSSSDSCCGGGFSSSEAESVYSSRSSRPKPIRTSFSDPPKISSSVLQRKSNSFEIHQEEKRNCVPQQKPNNGNGFIKTKSRAMKIYGDLKKVKQPISPGGKLASFINSLFTAGNPKKPKFSSSVNGTVLEDDRKSKSGYSSTTTCSSASSFSRSCLSKTPSSSTRTKRSVRFYPVSVIVDEDCRPCGHKCLYEDEPGLMAVTTTVRKMGESPLMINEELKFHIMEKNRRVEEAARDLLKGYQKKKIDYEMRDVVNVNYEDDEEEDDDDDAASDSSSDLFELDHLATIGGIERYREELPVYETTHFDTNRAIANGLIL
ncbi:hypothetical protein BVC80_901g39 [Macleaya cordata]|uniref:Protein BIG GRAIN 1-like A n=1 Tax=Macleaya cordata TaxID=56857 RepID=A0A200QEK1_MACCD|nr:hypothetical protein BVC80_901g39 [Macleaya cordata]